MGFLSNFKGSNVLAISVPINTGTNFIKMINKLDRKTEKKLKKKKTIEFILNLFNTNEMNTFEEIKDYFIISKKQDDLADSILQLYLNLKQ